MAGGLAYGVVAMGIVALGEKAGLWHMAIPWEPYFLALLLINFALSAYVYLTTWRIDRRFSWRGLAVVVIVAAVIGPPRDYSFMASYPESGAYGAGVAPVLAVAANYVLLVLVGHGLMRLVAGPPGEDRLAPPVGVLLTSRRNGPSSPWAYSSFCSYRRSVVMEARP